VSARGYETEKQWIELEAGKDKGVNILLKASDDGTQQVKKGKKAKGWLGVMIQEITPELKDRLDLKDEKGALVADITSDSPAQKAGIKLGDVIIFFNGNEIKEVADLPYMVANTPINKIVRVDVIRKGKKKSLRVKIEEMDLRKFKGGLLGVEAGQSHNVRGK
jgi:serine protease Do